MDPTPEIRVEEIRIEGIAFATMQAWVRVKSDRSRQAVKKSLTFKQETVSAQDRVIMYIVEEEIGDLSLRWNRLYLVHWIG